MSSARPEKFEALREVLGSIGDAGGHGWITAFLIVVAVLFVVGTVLSSLALPLVLLRLHARLKEVERRLDALTARRAPDEPPPGPD